MLTYKWMKMLYVKEKYSYTHFDNTTPKYHRYGSMNGPGFNRFAFHISE